MRNKPQNKQRNPARNVYDTKILQVLALAKRPLTTNQICAYAGISYNTTMLHLKNLAQRKTVRKEQQSNRIYWTI